MRFRTDGMIRANLKIRFFVRDHTPVEEIKEFVYFNVQIGQMRERLRDVDIFN